MMPLLNIQVTQPSRVPQSFTLEYDKGDNPLTLAKAMLWDRGIYPSDDVRIYILHESGKWHLIYHN